MQEWKMHCSHRGDAKYKEDIVNTSYTGAAQGRKKDTGHTSTLKTAKIAAWCIVGILAGGYSTARE